MIIPDPDVFFYPSRIPDRGVKKAPDPRSGSAALLLSQGGMGSILTSLLPRQSESEISFLKTKKFSETFCPHTVSAV
jgi:hypothetical protein